MFSDDIDADLRRLADDPQFPHSDAARHAIRFRAEGDAADLVAIEDDPHPCQMTDVIFALAGQQRPWLNWVPMPTEAIANVANEVGRRRAQGEDIEITGLGLSAAEPPSAMTACRRVAGPVEVGVADFPRPDIRTPVRPVRYSVWRYDGENPVPSVPAPAPEAVRVLHEVAAEPWPSLLSGYLQAAPLGKLPLDDLLGMLSHLPEAPDTPRWRHLATTTPTYWYRLMQPWVCLGILHHAADEPWLVSTRREVLMDLAFGVEDWVSDAALFALVTVAFREPEQRHEVRALVRARLDAAMAAPRLVTIEESLARLMLVTPGCTADDRAAAAEAIARAEEDDAEGEEAAPEPPKKKRRWWRHRD
ncbi:hypothetical protein [Paractinoplanes globisporus]|uniref:DUF4274 domain-containing protein n=1 Tax=Paractinoplanes globisporus TaxID=113565 RepID=A0ABW6W5N2_9ACTN|nr:hypothetical protein [Actinoplanes globisporus]